MTFQWKDCILKVIENLTVYNSRDAVQLALFVTTLLEKFRASQTKIQSRWRAAYNKCTTAPSSIPDAEYPPLLQLSNASIIQVLICIGSLAEHYVIYPDFPLELTGFFPGKHLIHFLVLKMKDFQNFVLDNCILDFDAEQVYFKLQVTNLKNNEVTVYPKPQLANPKKNPIP